MARLQRIRNGLIAGATFAMLASCGGGDSSTGGTSTPAPTPTPANRAPSFTSPASASVVENSTGTIYTATATDPDGNALAFSITGGADRAAFNLSSAGALSFVATPDFEAPADADRNNVYQVEITVSDGSLSVAQTVSITVTNDPNDTYRVRRITTALGQALFLCPVPDNSGRVFVVRKTGQINILNPAQTGGATPVFLDVSGIIATDGERGLLGMATAPDFATSGVFYIYMTNSAGTIEIRKYRTQTGNRDVADASTGDVILSIPHPTNNNHNGGWLQFGPDNMLYISVGDGGGGGDPTGNAQNKNVLLGKMLRIDPSSDAFPSDPNRDYSIPSGNPFATSGGSPEIWAYGLRNPFRNSFDPATGNLYIGDVGEAAVEEVDLMRPTDGGANFGWNIREGTQAFNGGSDSASFTKPVAEYHHGDNADQGKSIIGGYVYRGPVTPLRGLYFFADFNINNIWSIPVANLILGQTVPSTAFTRYAFAPDAGTIDFVTSFGVDQSNNLYILNLDGEIYRIEPGG